MVSALLIQSNGLLRSKYTNGICASDPINYVRNLPVLWWRWRVFWGLWEPVFHWRNSFFLNKISIFSPLRGEKAARLRRGAPPPPQPSTPPNLGPSAPSLRFWALSGPSLRFFGTPPPPGGCQHHRVLNFFESWDLRLNFFRLWGPPLPPTPPRTGIQKSLKIHQNAKKHPKKFSRRLRRRGFS